MTKKIRLFVLGTGGMAAAHCKAFNADPRVQIVACADVELARAEKFSKEHHAGKAFGSLDEAIAWGEFDAATNVTPDSIHHPTTMKLLAAKKHELCEKPLAENFMLADEHPAMGHISPKTCGGTPVTFMIYVEDVDQVGANAVKCGMQVKKPIVDQFYGDRSGGYEDPFGHQWIISTHIEDVAPDEMEKRIAKLHS